MAQAEEKDDSNAFELLNKALGEYYKSQGNKTYYSEPTTEGKFLYYCEENGFELEDIDDELQNDAADCIYCDFDEDFPFDKTIKPSLNTEEEKLEEIFRIIKYCYENNKPPKFFSTLNLELNCDASDIKTAETKYTIQCPKIFKSQEETLREVFAIGLKNDFPFISYLVDAYQRDRMLTDGNNLTAAQWAKGSPYIKKINSKSKKKASTIQSAIETYMKRVAPRFHWKAMNKIQDDIQQIIQYFIASGQFIENLLQQGQTPPFGYDIVIVVKKAISTNQMVMPDFGSDSSGDDDDYDDAEDMGDLKDDNDNNKYLNDIEGKLEANKCAYISEELTADKRGVRFLMTAFSKFSKKLGDNYKKSGKDKEYDLKNYPRKKRFCTMIDRRGDKDSMVMFEPPSDSNTLPDEHVPDWYFNAGKTCIVPSKGYNNGNICNTGSGNFDPQDIICVDRAYKGQVITLSYHVDSSVNVRCYLFWNGCYIRVIYPSDLIVILNSIFDIDHKGNKKYIKEKIEDDINKIKVVNDDTFDAFYKEVKIKKQ